MGRAGPEALLGYWFGSGKLDLIGGMPHGPALQVGVGRWGHGWSWMVMVGYGWLWLDWLVMLGNGWF